MSRRSPNTEKLIEASRKLLDWISVFGLPANESSRATFATMLNDLDTAAGARIAENSDESKYDKSLHELRERFDLTEEICDWALRESDYEIDLAAKILQKRFPGTERAQIKSPKHYPPIKQIKFPCVENTLEIEYCRITVRLWLDRPLKDIGAHPHTPLILMVEAKIKEILTKSRESGTGIPNFEDLIREILDIPFVTTQVNAIQINEKVLGPPKTTRGVVAYVVPFEDVHG